MDNGKKKRNYQEMLVIDSDSDSSDDMIIVEPRVSNRNGKRRRTREVAQHSPLEMRGGNKRKRDISGSGLGGRPQKRSQAPGSDADLARALAMSRTQASSDLRREQDAAYQLSVAMDKSKQLEAERLEAVRKAEEEQRKRKEEEERNQKELYKTKLHNSLSPEPAADADAVAVRLDVPNGRFLRRFAPEAPIDQLFIWIELVYERCRAQKYQLYIPPSSGYTKQRMVNSEDPTRHTTTCRDAGVHRCCIRVVVDD